MNQISIFDFIDEKEYLSPDEKIFADVLERGSNIEDSIERIKANIHLPMDDFILFLKKEFGICGTCWTGYHTWWDQKGLQVGAEWGKMKLYT